jgi:hypothetical protein
MPEHQWVPSGCGVRWSLDHFGDQNAVLRVGQTQGRWERLSEKAGTLSSCGVGADCRYLPV